ncbi:Imm8 family immunity protein [Deinococcus hopiensis]|uniref:Imm8 family immunity protein n=1 Tax=Deinococcus hopiensis TaxID=309885 RepID=UPI0014835D1A|nr:Imm8 family immunity protein [Deinococcus hopiensis]
MTYQAEIQSWNIFGDWREPEEYEPADQQDFNLILQFEVGFLGEVGNEVFSIHVASLRFLQRSLLESRVVPLVQSIIVEQWDFSQIRRAIEDHLSNQQYENWEQLQRRTRLIGRSEFD